MSSTELQPASVLFKTSYAGLDDALLREGPCFPAAARQEPEDEEGAADRTRLRAIFISDLHIGTPGFQAEALLDFLKNHSSDTLYLVGDIVDGWQLRRR